MRKSARTQIPPFFDNDPYGNAHYRYIQSRARCDFGLSKKLVYLAERSLLGVETRFIFKIILSFQML